MKGFVSVGAPSNATSAVERGEMPGSPAAHKGEQEHLGTDLGRETLAKSGTQLQRVVRLLSPLLLCYCTGASYSASREEKFPDAFF